MKNRVNCLRHCSRAITTNKSQSKGSFWNLPASTFTSRERHNQRSMGTLEENSDSIDTVHRNTCSVCQKESQKVETGDKGVEYSDTCCIEIDGREATSHNNMQHMYRKINGTYLPHKVGTEQGEFLLQLLTVLHLLLLLPCELHQLPYTLLIEQRHSIPNTAFSLRNEEKEVHVLYRVE